MPATIYTAQPVEWLRRTNGNISDHTRLFTITGQTGVWVRAKYIARRAEDVPAAAAPTGGNLFAVVGTAMRRDPLNGVNEFARDATLEAVIKAAATGL